MKNLFSLFLFLTMLTYSCVDNELSSDLSINQFTKLSKEQLDYLKITNIINLKNTDQNYSSISKELQNAAISYNKTHQSRVNIEFGDFYLIETSENRQASILRIASAESNDEYILKISSKYYYLDFYINDPNEVSGLPVFSFTISDMNGVKLSNGNYSRTSDWSDCMSGEFYKLCAQDVFSTIICNAGAAACPECGLIVLAAIGISCLW